MQPEPEKHIVEAAEVLWQYMKMNHALSRSDALIAMGSHDLRVAEYAARLVLAAHGDDAVCFSKSLVQFQVIPKNLGLLKDFFI